MTTDVTPRWGLPQLFSGQAQKELFHNEALARIDMLLHGEVKSADENEPPLAPDVGDCWIVGSGATGPWAGKEDAIACWTEGGWRFAVPRTGLSLWVADRANSMHYAGGSGRMAGWAKTGCTSRASAWWAPGRPRLLNLRAAQLPMVRPEAASVPSLLFCATMV